MNPHQSVAFVLNIDSNGLGVARSLGRAGIQVLGVDHTPNACGLFSKYVKSVVTANPAAHPEQTLQDLINRGKTLGQPGILFPTSDAYVLFISRFRPQLEPYFRFALPPEEVIEGMVNKRRQYDAAERLGVPIPNTFYPSSPGEVQRISKEMEYPAFIKPYYSHLWQTKFANKGFLVSSADELKTRYDEIFAAGLEAMVQSVIPGPNTNHVKVCAYFNSAHEPLAVFLTRKIRQYPTDFGVGTLMESTSNDEVKGLGLRFFRGVNYRGVGSIEFKKDDRDGQYKMIELNARLWQQNVQATYAGMNFPLLQYFDLTSEHVEPLAGYELGVKWFDAIQDFQAYLSLNRNGSLTTLEWLRSWLGSDCYAYFAWDDLRPGWRNSEYGMKYLKLPWYFFKRHTHDRPA